MNVPTKPVNAALVVAAGRGERAGFSGGPKQYRMLGRQSVIARTLSTFCNHPDIDLVLVVIHADDAQLYADSTQVHDKLLPTCTGGDTRQASVHCGLLALKDKNVENVLIHDAVRPFVSAALISQVVRLIGVNTGVLPATALNDTIKRADNGLIEATIPRAGLYAAQTPQGFCFGEILAAHEKAAGQSANLFTDDASIAEWAGMTVRLIDGERNNQKLTMPEDFAMAEKLLQLTVPDVRTGNGYDVHAFEPGQSVRLCGVDIAHSASLKGHSDADVGLHALTDALLGAVCNGDIGSHFPPSDPRWRDANSEVFFCHAVELITAQNGTITHLDVTLVCETPKIGPHRDKMRGEIARMANVNLKRVSVKATTSERLGFVGREEGIAAIASATVVFADEG